MKTGERKVLQSWAVCENCGKTLLRGEHIVPIHIFDDRAVFGVSFDSSNNLPTPTAWRHANSVDCEKEG